MIQYNLMRNISLRDIDFSSDDYLLDYCGNISIYGTEEKYVEEYGVICPPFFVREDNRYKIITGKRYIDVYKKHNVKIPFGLIIEKMKNRYEFLVYLIHLKKELGGFNAVEKSTAIKKFHDINEKLNPEIPALLEIPKSEKAIQNYLTLAVASDCIKTLIVNESLNEITAFEIFRFRKKDWDRIAQFIVRISLGTKKRNKMLSMIHDISERDKKRVDDIIDNSEVKRILKLKMDPPHIGGKLFSYFEGKRYPIIHQYGEEFNKKLKEVGISQEFHVHIPENFEKWEFKITFPFSSIADFKKKVGLLKETGDKSSFAKLMDMRY